MITCSNCVLSGTDSGQCSECYIKTLEAALRTACEDLEFYRQVKGLSPITVDDHVERYMEKAGNDS